MHCEPALTPNDVMKMTPYHAKYFAYELTKRCPSDSMEKLAGAVAGAQVDLNPHQVDAALFAYLGWPGREPEGKLREVHAAFAYRQTHYPKLKDSFTKALNILNKMPLPHELVNEEEAKNFVDHIEKDVAHQSS